MDQINIANMDTTQGALVLHEDSNYITMCDGNRSSSTSTKLSAMFGERDTAIGLFHDEGGVNGDKLLALFGGCRENVEYFVGLWDAVKDFSLSHLDCGNLPLCDPRDVEKRDLIKDWGPVARVIPSDVGVCESDDVGPGTQGRFAARQTVLDGEKKEECKDVCKELPVNSDENRFHCGVYGCGEVLMSVASYESHYHHCHNYVCATCRRVLVSNFLLDIHLQENHDSYFAVLSPRIDMYRCLVESCELKFRTAELRKDHLVTVHKFPSNFSFHQPVKEHRSKGKLQLSSNPSSSMDTFCDPMSAVLESDNSSMDTDSFPVASAVPRKNKKKSAVRKNVHPQEKRIPSSVCFGRGSQRAFEPRRGRGRNWYQTKAAMETDTAVDIETVDMNDLKNALTS